MLLFLNTMCKELKVLCDTIAIQKFSIGHSLCKQNLCSTSLSKCIWCLPARVKLWTLLKHSFSQITCIFLYIMTKVCVHIFVNLILETIAHLFIWLAFSFWWIWSSVFGKLLRIKECSPIPLSFFAELCSFNLWLQICQLCMGYNKHFIVQYVAKLYLVDWNNYLFAICVIRF